MAFHIEFMPDAWEHIEAFTARNRSTLLDSIEEHLSHQPDVKTRRRKPLRLNSLAGWELRVEDFRVFYDIVPEDHTVYVVAVGIKKRNLLFIDGERFVLS